MSNEKLNDPGRPLSRGILRSRSSKSMTLVQLTKSTMLLILLLGYGVPNVQAYVGCASGWYLSGTDCLPNWNGLTSLSTTSVPAQFFNYKGTLAGTNIACPAGYSCAGGTDKPVECTSGTYSAGSLSTCASCGTNACSLTAVATVSAGYFKSATYPNVASPCPAGFLCAGGASAPTMVAAGQYSSAISSVVTSCVAGKYCPSPGVAYTPSCPAGLISAANAAYCTAPAAGSISNNGISAVCPAGTYSIPGIDTTCQTCPSGMYCLAGATAPRPCNTGTYSLSGATAATCTSCDAGYSCTLKGTLTMCPAGTTSALGKSTCTPCESGFYCSSSTGGLPVACATNQWSGIGASVCTATTAGYAADPSKKTQGLACGLGFYIDASNACVICPQGFYCPNTQTKTACTTAQYCPVGSTSVGACPDWYDCTNNIMCDDGKYMTAAKTCVACEAGFTCQMRSYSAKVAVSLGYYSPAGHSAQYICPGGFACDTQSPVACAAGWFSVESVMTCTICPVDWACPNKELDYTDQIYCPNQRGMWGLGLTGQTSCTPVVAGYYIEIGQTTPTQCPQGTWSAGAAMACHECPPGYICPSKVQPQMSKCLVGSYNLLYDQIVCQTCEAGYYCSGEERGPCPVYKYSLSGWGICKFAPAGYYLINQQNIIACPAGTYAIFGSGDSTKGVATCQTCPVGHFCSNPAIPPQACVPGQYQPSTGQTSCLSCAAGTYSLFRETQCHVSPAGYKLFSTGSVPRMCPPFTYSTPSFTSATCTPSPQYYYLSAGSTDQETTTACPWGFYCNAGEIQKPWSNQLYGTAGGWYFNTMAIGTGSSPNSYMAQCPAGFFCPYGTMLSYPCPAGHYCSAGSGLPTPCPAGYYSINIMQTTVTSCTANPCPANYECNIGSKYPQACTGTCDTSLMPPGATVVTCAAGTYAGNDVPVTAASCNSCWQGHYCPAALAALHSFPIRCPKGTYQPDLNKGLLTDCLTCPVGMVCPYTGQRTLETGLVCEGGYACPAGTYQFRQYPCPEKTYSDATPYLNALSACTTCPDGYLCSEATNILYNPMKLCPAGYYCIAGVQIPCPLGKYSTQIGATNSNTCLVCPAGFFCGVATIDYTLFICAAGAYCPEGSSISNPFTCPTGTYSTQTGMKSSTQCIICPVGYYCQADPITNIVSPIVCPIGTYSSRILAVTLTDGGSRGCINCPAGYYCPTAPTFEPIACPKGEFSAASSSACTLCPVNFYCDKEATTNTGYTAIEDGFYYIGGAGLAERPYHINSIYSCPPGYYCAGNTKTACPTGTYQSLYGQTSVIACLITPAGYYNNLVASTTYFDTPCPTAMYCFAGTKTSLGYALSEGKGVGYPVLCPKGTFRSQTRGTILADCGICPAGYVCSEYTTEPLICSPGYYCPQGSESMQACPTGTFGSGYGLTSIIDCSPCFGGRYCAQIASPYISGLCDQQYYCVQSSNTPVPQYKTVGDTTDFLGRIFPIGDFCAAGGYCGKGSKFPKPCPAGQYQPATRAIDSTSCINCPQGQYCNGSPTTARTDILDAMKPYVPKATPTGNCYAGYYCTGSAYSPKQFTAPIGTYTLEGAWQTINCAVGTYNPFMAQSSCLPCPAGYYCDIVGMSLPKDCPYGYFCGPGSKNIISNPSPVISTALALTGPCPVSTYGVIKNIYQSSDCQICTSGKFCATTGLTAPTGNCLAGYYCLRANTRNDPPATTTKTQGGPCPVHHSCASGVGLGTPALPGIFSTLTGLQVPSTTLMTAGQWSHTVSVSSTYFTTVTMATGSCAIGYYCPEGSSWAFSYQYKCKVGQFCPASSTTFQTCAVGYYQPNQLQAKCFDCPKGFFCDGTQQSDLITFKCPPGYYCPARTTSATQYPCPVGTYNDHYGATSLSECVKAPPGYFISTTAATSVSVANKCSGGYYCNRGSSTATPTDGVQGNRCTIGNYCPIGSPKMISCTPGWRCTQNTLTTPDLQCSSGKYCVRGTGTGVGSTCPAGYICPTGTPRPVACKAGTYQPSTGKGLITDCLDCPAGYFCPQPTSTSYLSNICAAGYYCPLNSVVGTQNLCPVGNKCVAGSSTPIACSITNQYQDETGAVACKNCPAGYTCTDIAAQKCTPQNEGPSYYCSGGLITVGKTACAAGKYNLQDGSASSSDCKDCPAGFFCPLNPTKSNLKIQICPAGSYCLEGQAAGTTCPVGFYCPEGTNVPIPCPRGYYGASTGMSLQYCSGPCTAGYYCNFITITQSATLCINEVSCISGSITPTQANCGAGNYCPLGSVLQIPCPIGTYSANLNNKKSSDCTACDPGKYCYTRGLIAPQDPCQQGYYCSGGSDQATSEECPAGNKCPAGSSEPTKCQAGTYQPNEIQASCFDCPPGYYCPEEQMLAPIICSEGYYCPNSANTQQTPCPEGTWSSTEGLNLLTQCLSCPFGKYCSFDFPLPLLPRASVQTSSADAFECPELYKCYDPTASSFQFGNKIACVDGEICPVNTIVPSVCPPGTYTNPLITGAMSAPNCLSCPQGKFCPSWGLTQAQLSDCPDGYVCMGGAIDPSNLDDVTVKLCPAGSYCKQIITPPDTLTENLCKINYYNPKQGQSACLPCTAGFSCQQIGLVLPDPCPAGSYCPPFVPGSITPNVVPCPAGTYSSDMYLTSVTQCNSCQPGKYCLEGSTGFTGYCDEGYVCTGGQSTPKPSGIFQFTDYGDINSGPCPVGHYCTYGSAYPRKCRSGQYQNFTGQSSCKDCDEGYYCDRAGLSAPTFVCDPGFYCISGAIFAQPYDYQTGRICATGHFCIGGLEFGCYGGTYSPVEGLSECYICPAGFYCAANSITPIECITGHYCPRKSATPIVCPKGSYTQSYQVGLASKEQCSECPTGYYCDSGLFERENKCSAGYFCLSGAKEPSQVGLECPQGYYCLEGSRLPTACPDGKYTIKGAKTEEDCKDCIAGYYCVRYISSSAMVICPKGYYCPDGVNEPQPCPKGTFNNNEKQNSLDDCKPCPAGTACDVTGITDYTRKMCPPGYYCPEGTFTPLACSPGTWRPNSGASTKTPAVFQVNAQIGIASCFYCVPGYFCPNKAQVVPEICPKGYYCLQGADQPVKCPPGYYCPAGSGAAVPCPKGYYCIGGTDTYIKCGFGYYCPMKSPHPFPCPNGSYGSGSVNNFDEASGCVNCGRGMYSENDPTQCTDCTPGYVCLGKTSSITPLDKNADGGFICPKGSYCPLGSYQPVPCPIGTYSKNEGSTSIKKCIPCKVDTYSDLPGQGGCKQCGPTSQAFGGATTCQCLGANRNFIKSLGSCLCSTGFKPKNNAQNVDSSSDCEAIAIQVCTTDQFVDLEGRCVEADKMKQNCDVQCPGVGGSYVQGTGLCQCSKITDVNQVCDAQCQKQSTIKSSLGPNGLMTIVNPLTKQTSKVDPSTLPGYFGEFKCQTTNIAQTSCNVVQMGVTDNGSFTYEFSPNQDVLNATNITNNDQNLTGAILRNQAIKKAKLEGRKLDTTIQAPIPRITNPTVCIKEGDAVFFNVVPQTLNYPVYYKDSLLNSNKFFDYGPFTTLENMIQQGVKISTFSFIFREYGVYVFTNKGSGTITTITVVLPSQTCSGATDGIAVSMVTKESLANQGVTAGQKSVQPDWWFISLEMIAILSFLFLVMGLFILAYNAKIKNTPIFSKKEDTRKSSIYYDKLIGRSQSGNGTWCCGLFGTNKVDKDAANDSKLYEAKIVNEYEIKYKDLEHLLEEFNRAQEVLNRQLTDKELHQRRVDENGNLIEQMSNEDSLLKEVNSLLLFVKQNHDVLNQTLSHKNEDQNSKELELNKKQNALESIKNDLSKKMASHLNQLVAKNVESEKIFSSKFAEKAKGMQMKAYEIELTENDALKQKLLDEYALRLQNSRTTDEERDALLAELHAKMSQINDLAAEEQEHQNHNINEMLKRRRGKKEKLHLIMEKLGEKRIKEDEKYQEQLLQIKQQELDDKKAIDLEIDQLRIDSQHDIQAEINQKRMKAIADSEKRLEDHKRKYGKGDPQAELEFADMLQEYGNKVIKLDKELAIEKQKQNDKLEQQLKERKQSRLREVEVQRKQQEQLLNNETVEINAQITTETKQVESLLNPIKDEDARMEIIISQNKPVQTVFEVEKNTLYKISPAAEQAMKDLQQNDDQKEINQILNKIDNENEIKRREIANHREMIEKQIANCVSDDEKQRLMRQLENFETNLQQQLAQQQDMQNKKLKEAIEARRNKRKGLMNTVAQEKEHGIKKDFKSATNNKLNFDNNSAKELANRIQGGFNKYEAVQVTENFLDQKNEQEAIDLMNALFQERAKALRLFMLDLMTQKQADLDLLADEYEPQKEFLRQKRVRKLLNLEEFTSALERITLEETERQHDIEIAYADKEKEIKQELELLKLQADNEQMKALKDIQTKEKIVMFSELMKNMDEQDAMKKYIKKSINEVQIEAESYKRMLDKDKSSRIMEIQDEHKRKMKEMEDRQNRLVNVDEMLKKEESKYMERFRRQREELLARKLAEQQRELLKEMSQKDVDQLLDSHKRDLGAMDEVLNDEQQRQMEKMKERLKTRNAAKAREGVVRQIKLAEIQKSKALQVQQAKLYEQAGGDLASSIAREKQKAQMQVLVEKADLMQRMCQKQCYSRKIYFKRHIANQQRLNSFLGRGILTDWESSRGGYPDDVSGMSQLTLNTEDLKAQVNESEEKITYAVLLQHIDTAQHTYDQIRKQEANN